MRLNPGRNFHSILIGSKWSIPSFGSAESLNKLRPGAPGPGSMLPAPIFYHRLSVRACSTPLLSCLRTAIKSA